VSDEKVVVRADHPRRRELEGQGRQVVARSWAAQLNAANVDLGRLRSLVDRARFVGVVRELGPADVSTALALDAATLGDYPGGVATSHTPLTIERATVSPERRAFGVVGQDGGLVAMTFLDVDTVRAETDFTVVAPAWRGRGLGSAVKAASVLGLMADGVSTFRTGGSAENAASLAANRSVGYIVDEEWLTFEIPASAQIRRL
jgi:GNAT superfamily N-acetyltransferase